MSCCTKLETAVADELDNPKLTDILRTAADKIRDDASKIGITIGPEVEQHLLDFAAKEGHLIADKLRTKAADGHVAAASASK